ncbi:MAG: methyltransferase domain-containing protein [Candidatus Dojkabacteria bacterium]
MKQFLKNLDVKVFKGLHDPIPDYLRIIEKEIVGCESLLDVGCGGFSPLKDLNKKMKKSFGVDGFKPSIDAAIKRKTHSENKVINVLKLRKFFKDKSFDCIVALDLIEHLTKEEGVKLLDDLEKLAKKKVIIFTPNGFVPQDEYDGNAYQIHKSGWGYKEMEKKGYKVYGLNGLKALRGEYAKVKFKPAALWERISYGSKLLMKLIPSASYQILAVKNVSR